MPTLCELSLLSRPVAGLGDTQGPLVDCRSSTYVASLSTHAHAPIQAGTLADSFGYIRGTCWQKGKAAHQSVEKLGLAQLAL